MDNTEVRNKDYDAYIGKYFDIPLNVHYKKEDTTRYKINQLIKGFYEDESLLPQLCKYFAKGVYNGAFIYAVKKVWFSNKNFYLRNKLFTSLNKKKFNTFALVKHFQNEAIPILFFGGVSHVGYYFYRHYLLNNIGIGDFNFMLFGTSSYYAFISMWFLGINTFFPVFYLIMAMSYLKQSNKGKPQDNVVHGKRIPCKTDLDDKEINYLESREKIHFLGWKYFKARQIDMNTLNKEF